jgi:hypothetical protein
MHSFALSCAILCLGGAGARAAQDADAARLKALLIQADEARGEVARRLRADVARRLLDLPPARLREILGPPAKVARQILYRRYLEQWTYERPVALQLMFQCPRGQEPRLKEVRWTRP